MKLLLAIFSFSISVVLLGIFAICTVEIVSEVGLEAVDEILSDWGAIALFSGSFIFGVAFLCMGIACIDKTSKKKD